MDVMEEKGDNYLNLCSYRGKYHLNVCFLSLETTKGNGGAVDKQ